MTDALIIDACRTPRGIGKVGKGALADMHPQHVTSTVLGALAKRNQLVTADVDDVLWGSIFHRSLHPRLSALDAGFEPVVGGATLDRACGSSLTTISLAAASIIAGHMQLAIAGGTDMMSQAAAGAGASSGPPLLDGGNLRLRARWPQAHQGVCADAIATMEGISRQALEAWGLESQKRAASAIGEGRFARSIIPVYREDGTLALDHDQYPRPETTAESLAAMKPAFEAIADFPLNEEGLTFRKLIAIRFPDLDIQFSHHVGVSSGVVDGSAGVLLASPDYARKHGLKPRARIVAACSVGDDPTLMLNGPVVATQKVLAQAGLTLADIDLFEINEAFAVVVEKTIRDLGLDRDKVNVNGGAIALGHPIGATGAIMLGTLLDELERRDLKRGLVTMCAAGGMAPAIIIERIG
jgi:acetyl-CoA C-acetyltransferase